MEGMEPDGTEGTGCMSSGINERTLCIRGAGIEFLLGFCFVDSGVSLGFCGDVNDGPSTFPSSSGIRLRTLCFGFCCCS